MRTLALKRMEKEYRKLYKSGAIIIDEDTERMAKDIVEQSPVPLSVVGIGVEDVRGILDRVKGSELR